MKTSKFYSARIKRQSKIKLKYRKDFLALITFANRKVNYIEK
jgi:hypothetical protein